jgi:cytidylate kinase
VQLTIPPKRVVAIDGPAASGKSTTAAAVAIRLGFIHLNSGLLYRAITWRALQQDWQPGTGDFDQQIGSVAIELERAPDGLRVVVDGEDPGDALHQQSVAGLVSSVARVGEVRSAVLARLRAASEQFDLVCDGRDIGTTVFPNADLKVFLVASSLERARRRLLDLEIEAGSEELRAEAERLERRDRADATRELSPLRKATDAIEIDTTSLTAEAVIEAICGLAVARGMRSRRAGL